MEDCVPGTENGLAPVMLSTLTKQEKLDEFTSGPLVGVEYLLELQDCDPAKESSYLCILCNNPSDSHEALIHLSSFNHITLYLLKHFPTTYRAIVPYMTDERYKRSWEIALKKVAEGIEKKFGRLKPFAVDKDKFEQDRVQYLKMIAKGKHLSESSAYTFTELTGYTFEEFVVLESKSFEDQKSSKCSSTVSHDGTSVVKRTFRKCSPLSRNPSSAIRERQLPYAKRVFISPSCKSRSRSRSPRRRNSSRRFPSYARQNNRDRQGRNSHEGGVNIKKEKLRNNGEFEKLARVLEISMKHSLKYNEKNPEKHPRYNQEWKKFWNRRYNELQMQGVDVESHELKPEWIRFWKRRMVELHNQELKSKRDALKRRCGHSEDLNLEQDNEVITSDDKGSIQSRNLLYNSGENQIGRSYKNRVWKRENAQQALRDEYYKPSHVMCDEEDDDDDIGEINVVDVFRILTALEEWLGSLGPKVIDLLGQALAMEKKDPNSSENLLDSDINYMLLETIQEKLRGQFMAGFADMIQAKAFKKAIRKITRLLHLSNQRKQQRETLKTKLSAVLGVGNSDRTDIANQIANALVLQGKTDVSHAELEQLINTMVRMAETSKSKNKTMTMANFLQQISESMLENNLPLNTETGDKIIIPTSVKKDAIEKLMKSLIPSPENDSQKLEYLSDSDLKTLIQNFKDLCTEEQHNLINFLRKTEDCEPERAEKLWRFVRLEDLLRINEGIQRSKANNGDQNNLSGVNPTSNDIETIESDEEEEEENVNEVREEKKKESPRPKIHIDSEEEDYTIEDVVKSVSKNVKQKELTNNMKVDSTEKSCVDLSSAKDIISYLMNNINRARTSDNVDTLGLSGPSISESNLSTNTSDTCGGIDMASLASIVSNVKNLTEGETGERQIVSGFPVRRDKPETSFFGTSERISDELKGTDETRIKDGQIASELTKPDNMYVREGSERLQNRSFGNDARSFGNDVRSFGNDTRSFGNDVRSFGNDVRSFGNDARSFGELSARPDDKSFGGVTPRSNDRNFACESIKLDDIHFGEEAERLDNRSYGGVRRQQDDRSFGRFPPRIDEISFGRVFTRPGDDTSFERVPIRQGYKQFEDEPPRLEDRPFSGLPTRLVERSDGRAFSRIDNRPFMRASSSQDSRSFEETPSRLASRPFGGERSSLHDVPLGGASSNQNDRSFGGRPPRLDDGSFRTGFSRPEDRSFEGAPPKLEDRPFRSRLRTPDSKPFGVPPKLNDSPFRIGSSRINDRPFGGAPLKLHERAQSPLGLDSSPIAGRSTILNTRPFAGELERPYRSKLGLVEEKPFSLGSRPGKPYAGRPYKTFGGNGPGRLENKLCNRPGYLTEKPGKLEDRSFSSRIEERLYPNKTIAPRQTEKPASSFSGPVVSSNLGRKFFGPAQSLNKDFDSSGFPRNTGPHGNMQPHSQFSDVPGQPPNVPDQRSSISNIKDFW